MKFLQKRLILGGLLAVIGILHMSLPLIGAEQQEIISPEHLATGVAAMGALGAGATQAAEAAPGWLERARAAMPEIKKPSWMRMPEMKMPSRPDWMKRVPKLPPEAHLGIPGGQYLEEAEAIAAQAAEAAPGWRERARAAMPEFKRPDWLKKPDIDWQGWRDTLSWENIKGQLQRLPRELWGLARSHPAAAVALSGGAVTGALAINMIAKARNIVNQKGLTGQETLKLQDEFKTAFSRFTKAAGVWITVQTLHGIYAGTQMWRSGLRPMDLINWIRQQNPGVLMELAKDNPAAVVAITGGALSAVMLARLASKALDFSKMQPGVQPRKVPLIIRLEGEQVITQEEVWLEDATLRQARQDLQTAWSHLKWVAAATLAAAAGVKGWQAYAQKQAAEAAQQQLETAGQQFFQEQVALTLQERIKADEITRSLLQLGTAGQAATRGFVHSILGLGDVGREVTQKIVAEGLAQGIAGLGQAGQAAQKRVAEGLAQGIAGLGQAGREVTQKIVAEGLAQGIAGLGDAGRAAAESIRNAILKHPDLVQQLRATVDPETLQRLLGR